MLVLMLKPLSLAEVRKLYIPIIRLTQYERCIIIYILTLLSPEAKWMSGLLTLATLTEGLKTE
jgi:hypothetical protein